MLKFTYGSSKYRQYYTLEEIIDVFVPAKYNADNLSGGLESAVIEAQQILYSTSKQWLRFDAKVG